MFNLNCRSNKNYNKGAFTLAEVLLTLTIVGVIAAVTIPSIIMNTRNNELKVA